MTTKEQERKALAQIKKIVEGLGEGSYIGTAFEGCFEIAEQNIENDFACSMQQRAESAEFRAEEAEKKIKTLELDNRDLRLAIKNAKEEASRRCLPSGDIAYLHNLVKSEIAQTEELVKRSAEEIVKLADDPDGQQFGEAVRNHRTAKQRIVILNDLLDDLNRLAQ